MNDTHQDHHPEIERDLQDYFALTTTTELPRGVQEMNMETLRRRRRPLFAALTFGGVLAVAGAATVVALAAHQPKQSLAPASSPSAAPATPTPTPRTAPSATPTPQATPTSITPQPVATPQLTSAQSIATAKRVFPLVPGTLGDPAAYSTCDYFTSNCPLSKRLRAELAHYDANDRLQCPTGCGHSNLIERGQCGGHPTEAVTAQATKDVAQVVLGPETNGGCGNVRTYHVHVILENGQPVADDITCYTDDPRFGMYNPDRTASGPVSCG